MFTPKSWVLGENSGDSTLFFPCYLSLTLVLGPPSLTRYESKFRSTKSLFSLSGIHQMALPFKTKTCVCPSYRRYLRVLVRWIR